MQQQLARSHRLVVDVAALRVGRDVHVFQPGLVTVDAYETIAKLDLARPQRLHLGASEHDARLVVLIHEVVMEGTPVDRDLFIGHPPPAAAHPAPAPPRGRSDRPPPFRAGPSPARPARAG